jgi:hypothetical protein
MAYFNYFPKIGYDVRGEKNNVRIEFITNILTRTRKKLEVTNNNFFDKYFVKDGDRPDILAHKFYGDSDLHWIILYANYMTNPWYDWPMTYFDLQKYVAKKYDDVNGIHHYIDEDGYEVDSTTANATAITNFVYEEAKNDESRSINIPKVIYTQQIINELKDIM